MLLLHICSLIKETVKVYYNFNRGRLRAYQCHLQANYDLFSIQSIEIYLSSDERKGNLPLCIPNLASGRISLSSVNVILGKRLVMPV